MQTTEAETNNKIIESGTSKHKHGQTQHQSKTKQEEKTPVVDDEKEPDTCGVCYVELNTKNVVNTSCNHQYCNKCFFKFLWSFCSSFWIIRLNWSAVYIQSSSSKFGSN